MDQNELSIKSLEWSNINLVQTYYQEIKNNILYVMNLFINLNNRISYFIHA